MQYRHEIAEAAVEALTAESTDQQIAVALADYLLAGRSSIGPFTLAINHNAKATLCPMRIDRPGIKSSSATLPTAERAHAWIIEALTRAYEVSTMTNKGHETRSIARVRSRIRHEQQMAEYRAKRKANPGAPDDDIPF